MLCTENVAVVNHFPAGDSTDLMVSDCNTTDYDFAVVFRENGVANEGDRTAELRLVPSIQLDQDGIVFRENISVTILDLDSKE